MDGDASEVPVDHVWSQWYGVWLRSTGSSDLQRCSRLIGNGLALACKSLDTLLAGQGLQLACLGSPFEEWALVQWFYLVNIRATIQNVGTAEGAMQL